MLGIERVPATRPRYGHRLGRAASCHWHRVFLRGARVGDGHGTSVKLRAWERDRLGRGENTDTSAWGQPETQGRNRGTEAREVHRMLTWGGGTSTERNRLRTDTHSPRPSGHKNDEGRGEAHRLPP